MKRPLPRDVLAHAVGRDCAALADTESHERSPARQIAALQPRDEMDDPAPGHPTRRDAQQLDLGRDDEMRGGADGAFGAARSGIRGFDQSRWSGGQPRAPPTVGSGGHDGGDVEVLAAVVGSGEHVDRLAGQSGASGRSQPAVHRGPVPVADAAAGLEDGPWFDDNADHAAALDANLLAVAMDGHLVRDAPADGTRVAAGDLDLLGVGLLAHATRRPRTRTVTHRAGMWTRSVTR